jgi:D-sedoheptulose 7-phosphate isomerase
MVLSPKQSRTLVRSAFHEAATTLAAFLSDDENLDAVERFVGTVVTTLHSGFRIFACGNGGSMSDAMHFAGELAGQFRGPRAPLAAMAFSDPTTLSCIANDYGYEAVFSRQVQAQARRGDLLVLLSTSGNSPNMIEAAHAARELGVTTVALLGRGGGKLLSEVTIPILVPHATTSDRVQEVHIKILHVVVEAVEQQLVGDQGRAIP